MEPIAIGPCGGSGGSKWSYKPSGPITHIAVEVGRTSNSTETINSIQFKNHNANGVIENSPVYSRNRGGQIYTVDIDSTFEYLISIEGTIGIVDSTTTIIRSLQFRTNLKTYGPFGFTEGSSFSLSGKNSKIVGFHGQAGDYLDSIGVHLQPIPMELIALGPCGGSGGGRWNYKPNGLITQIVIGVFTNSNITSIRFKHCNVNGSIEESDQFGGTNTYQSHTINIKSPSEYLTSIDGTIGVVDRATTLIKSIRFTTNLNSYGPFGSQTGSNFSMQMKDSVIVGFHGQAGDYLDSIGIYVQP